MGSSCPNFSTPLKHIFANTVRATARVSTHGLLDDTCHPIHHATDHANFLCILLRVNCKHEGDETNVTPNPGGASQPGYYYLRIIRLSTKAFFDLRPALECRLSRSIKKKNQPVSAALRDMFGKFVAKPSASQAKFYHGTWSFWNTCCEINRSFGKRGGKWHYFSKMYHQFMHHPFQSAAVLQQTCF